MAEIHANRLNEEQCELIEDKNLITQQESIENKINEPVWNYDTIFLYVGELGGQQWKYVMLLMSASVMFGMNAVADTFLMLVAGKDASNPEFKDPNINCTTYTNTIQLADNGYLAQTVVTHFDLICSNSNQIELVSSLYFFSQVFASILSGILADNFGRKLPILFSASVVTVATFYSGWTDNWMIYMICRMLIAFCLIANLNAFVMIIELVGPKYREQFGVLVQVAFAFGGFILSPIAYLVRHFSETGGSYATMTLVLGVLNLIPVLIYFYCPESTRYLLSRGEVEKVKKILNQIAVKNGATASQKSLLKEHLDRYQPPAEPQHDKTYTFLDLFTHSKFMTIAILQSMFLWGTVSLVFYGVTLNVNRMPGNLYWTNIISASGEMISCSTLSPYIVSRFKFRDTLGFTYLGAAIGLLLTYLAMIYSNPGEWILITVCCFFGKFFIATTFSIVYNYTAGLFPTKIRANAISISSASARMGSTIRPYVAMLSSYLSVQYGFQQVVLLIYMGLSFISFLVCQSLIETFKKPMIMSFQDFDNAAKNKWG